MPDERSEDYARFLCDVYANDRAFWMSLTDIHDLKLLLLAAMRRREQWAADWKRDQDQQRRLFLLRKLAYLEFHTPPEQRD